MRNKRTHQISDKYIISADEAVQLATKASSIFEEMRQVIPEWSENMGYFKKEAARLQQLQKVQT